MIDPVPAYSRARWRRAVFFRPTGLFLCALLIAPFLGTTGCAAEFSFWVWQRTSPLTAPEAAGLERQHIRELYWQLGTLAPDGADWSWREQFPADLAVLAKIAPSIHFIPVVRLEPPAGWSFSPGNTTRLIAILNEIVRARSVDELQIDYEAPDRLIPAYVDFLRTLKAHRTWRLSISSLGHWSALTRDFAGVTDEITPMFYDLSPAQESLHGGALSDLADIASMAKQLRTWRMCPIPWKAGLPNFSRITVVGTDGASRGNLRSWLWDEIWFSPLLTPRGPTTRGQTIFDVSKSGLLTDLPVRTGETIVVRQPDLSAIEQVSAEAASDGAAGVLFFRLADSTDMSGYEVQDLVAVRSPAALAVRWQTESKLSLTASRSLMPIVSPSGGRGYALAVTTSGEGWREADPGDFSRVTTDAAGRNVVPSTLGLGVKTLYFWFGHLRAGQILQTGLIQRASRDAVRWHLQNFDPDSVWHSLD
jgi:hypothetical protein